MIVPDHRRATLNPLDATSGGFPFPRLAGIIEVQRRLLVYRRCVSPRRRGYDSALGVNERGRAWQILDSVNVLFSL